MRRGEVRGKGDNLIENKGKERENDRNKRIRIKNI